MPTGDAMNMSVQVAEFWRAYGAAAGDVNQARFYEAFSFGDSEAMSNSLAELVLSGRKRATAGLVWSYAMEGKRPPAPGDLSVMTDGSGRPLCVIRTTRVDLVPFNEVSAEFAAAEGEGDGSLAFWRQSHREYFSRECALQGRAFVETMLISCERFEVVFQPGAR